MGIEKVKATEEAINLLRQNRLGHVLVGDSVYVPNCTMEVTVGIMRMAVVIKNQDGIILAKGDRDPKDCNVPDVIISDVAWKIDFGRQ